MAITGEEIVRRKDYYEVNPREIRIEAGWNKRTDYTGHDELKASILANGVQRPILLRRDEQGAVLIDGERRLRAVLELIKEGNKIETVPAIYERRTISQTEAMLLQLVANDGKPFNPSEEGEAYRQLEAWGVAKEEIARRVGRSLTYVKNRLALVDAAAPVKKAVDKGEITIGRAKRIVKKHRTAADQAKALDEGEERVCDLGAVKKVLELELKWRKGELSPEQQTIGRMIIDILQPLV
jgi:ParB family chromosome partitioning protein